MFTYLISYDLGSPENRQSYNQLSEFIKNVYIQWAKPQKSVWIVKSSLPIAEVRDALRTRVDNNDKLLVIDITGRAWATYNQSNEINNWLRSNL